MSEEVGCDIITIVSVLAQEVCMEGEEVDR